MGTTFLLWSMVVTTLRGWGCGNTTPSEPWEEGLRPWCVHLPLLLTILAWYGAEHTVTSFLLLLFCEFLLY